MGLGAHARILSASSVLRLMQSKWNLDVSDGEEKDSAHRTACIELTSPCNPRTVSSRPWLPSGTRSTSSSRAAVWTSLFRHPQPRAFHPALRLFVHLQLDLLVLPRFVVVLSQQLRPSSAWPSQPQGGSRSLQPPQPSRIVFEHECWPVWPWSRMDELDGGREGCEMGRWVAKADVGGRRKSTEILLPSFRHVSGTFGESRAMGLGFGHGFHSV